MARINFVAGLVGDPSLPGVRAIIDRLKAKGHAEPRAAGRRVSGPAGPGGGELRNAARARRAGQGVGPDRAGQSETKCQDSPTSASARCCS